MATWEEASKCPKCGLTGEAGKVNFIRGSRDRLIQLTCMNKVCKWYNTSWPVQVRPDGSVPDADTRPREKEFPERMGGLIIHRSMEQLERELEASKEPGAEIRRRGV